MQSTPRFKWELGGGRGYAGENQQAGAVQSTKDLHEPCAIAFTDKRAGRGRGMIEQNSESCCQTGLLQFKKYTGFSVARERVAFKQKYPSRGPPILPTAHGSATSARYKRSKPHQLVRLPATNQPPLAAVQVYLEGNRTKQIQGPSSTQAQQLIRIGQRKLVRKFAQKPPLVTARTKRANVWVRGGLEGPPARHLRSGGSFGHLAIGNPLSTHMP